MKLPKGPDQRIIVYGSGDGVVYDTAYTDDQASEAMNRCVRTYGRRASVRAIPSRRRTVEGS